MSLSNRRPLTQVGKTPSVRLARPCLRLLAAGGLALAAMTGPIATPAHADDLAIEHTGDPYFIPVTPEPGVAALIAPAALMLLGRRRATPVQP